MTEPLTKADVLEEFALEAETDPGALQRYVALYPDFALDLIDLARELLRPLPDDPAPLTPCEEALIDQAWQIYQGAASTVASQAGPVLQGRAVQDMREIATRLGVPRQVLSALREGRILFASITDHFLGLLAAAADSTVDIARRELNFQAPLRTADQFKADAKIVTPQQISLEQALIDAGVPPDQRRHLLGES